MIAVTAMIKINIDKIANWDKVQDKHSKFVRKIIESQIAEFEKSIDGIYIVKANKKSSKKREAKVVEDTDKRKMDSIVTIDKEDINCLQHLFNADIKESDKNLSITFNSDNPCKDKHDYCIWKEKAGSCTCKIAVCKIDSIMDLYYESLMQYEALKENEHLKDNNSIERIKRVTQIMASVEGFCDYIKNEKKQTSKKEMIKKYITDIGNEYFDAEFVELSEAVSDKSDATILSDNDSLKKEMRLNSKYLELEELLMRMCIKLDRILEFILDYSLFYKDDEWNRHSLLQSLNINVCPYCNRQYITSYKEKNTADVDHYYLKSKYPVLGLSLYNFIPSCQICNSRFKKQIDAYTNKHIYPFEEEFSKDAKFSIKGRRIEFLTGDSKDFEINIKVKNDCDKSKQIKNSIKSFHLEELYNAHTDYVQELIKKAIIYNESNIEELLEFTDLFASREEILRIIFGNYITDDDLNKRPLAKLTKDICEELGIDLEV